MVSRSRQSDSIIAVICQAALRYKRHNISSWFLRSLRLLLDGYNCQIHTFRFPAGIRFSQEEFCRISGEYRLQTKSIRESCSLLREKILQCQTRAQKEQHLHFLLVTVQEAQKGFCGCKTGLLQRTSSSPRRLFLPVVYVTTLTTGKRGIQDC